MKRKVICLVIATLLFSCKKELKSDNSAQKKDESYTTKIDRFLETLEKEQTFMGSVAISDKDKLVYSKAIGFSNAAKDNKVNIDTKYRIGSISKTFTAVLVFKAIEENKIQLNQTIDKFFPKLKNGNTTTIAHLLHHQSGIESYTKDKYFWEHRTKEQSSEALINAISNLERTFKPGEHTAYSNSNYFLLTEILEVVFKDSYENILQKYIISPLELNHTSQGKKIQPEKNESLSFVFKEDKWEVFPETHISLAKGSGSIISTPKDLNNFYRSLFKERLISSENLEKMTTIVRNHGMGIFNYKLNDQSGFGHGGNIDGFTATAIYFKELDLAVSITSNASKQSVDKVYAKVLELYLGQSKVKISQKELETYIGTYAAKENPSEKAVFEREGNTLIHVIMGEYREPLIYKGDRRFLFNQMYGGSISFTFSEDGKELLFEQGDFKGNYIKESLE
ncbi:serine hydrolase domain-containing protein [uncultured Tenacibaculum sp.]|uniref:serine hydrolase domain-containing protein n=1 Tax=uncultured Tenacibaculum sp. TaxID=174713 RepID=UPI0026227D19|nr:serine hydrolase domain-containing protein [uncultured Tenacibaculum sp.]